MSIFDKHKKNFHNFIFSQKELYWQQNLAQNNWAQLLFLFEEDALFWNEKLPADKVYPLALYALEQRRGKSVLSIVNNFAKRFPQHGDIVRNYVLVMKALREQLASPEEADLLWQKLNNDYPQHPDLNS